MSNATALRAVLAHVQEHQADWRQGEWTNCFAGHTLRLLEGATSVSCACCHSPVLLAIGERQYQGHFIGVKAAEILELTPEQALALFEGSNSLQRLTELVEKFIAEDAERLAVALAA